MVYYLYAPAREYLTVCSRDNHEDECFLPFSWKCSIITRGEESQETAGGRDEEGD
jgi:hypothetical protein